MMKSASDQVEVRVTMSAEEMDTFVFCLASKKSAARLAKEMTDLVRAWFQKGLLEGTLI